MLDAKMAVLRAIRQLTESGQGHSTESERHWKLPSTFDAMMLSIMPRQRNGRRGQGVHGANAIYSSRFRAFWSGAWVQLLAELDAAQQHTNAKPINRSDKVQMVREASTIQSLFTGRAVSKAISRVSTPLRFATGFEVPDQLRNKFGIASDMPAQQPAPAVSADLREELCNNIFAELGSLPRMCGAGPTGTFYEHIACMRNIPGGLQLAADVAAMLITGEAPTPAVRLHRSGRCHPTIKPDTEADIRPLTSPSAYWRGAMRGFVRMYKQEVQTAVGSTQFGVAAPGGCAALRNELLARMLFDPSLALAPIDLKNMYGSMDIPNIEHETLNRVPRMSPLVAPWIREPREHVYIDDQQEVHRISASRALIRETQSVLCLPHLASQQHMKSY